MARSRGRAGAEGREQRAKSKGQGAEGKEQGVILLRYCFTVKDDFFIFCVKCYCIVNIAIANKELMSSNQKRTSRVKGRPFIYKPKFACVAFNYHRLLFATFSVIG